MSKITSFSFEKLITLHDSYVLICMETRKAVLTVDLVTPNFVTRLTSCGASVAFDLLPYWPLQFQLTNAVYSANNTIQLKLNNLQISNLQPTSSVDEMGIIKLIVILINTVGLSLIHI